MAKKAPRGLGALLARSKSSQDSEPRGPATEVATSLINANPFQPRDDFDASSLAKLVESILEKGVLQPLLVRSLGTEKYELIAGERRLRAANLAGMEQVPVIIMDVSETESLEIALIENLQREDLNALEVARGYQQLMETFGFSQEEVSQKVGKSRSGVANALRLLELPSSIQDLLASGKLTAGHCRALLACNAAQMEKLARAAVKRNLSVRQLEKLIYKAPEGKKKKEKQMRHVAPHIKAIQNHLSERMGTRVLVEEGSSKGRIIIEFYSNDDFERILNVFGLK